MRALIATVVLAASAAVAAPPLKLAVVYGHNGGTATRPPLRFAENDAARVAAALVEVAGVAPGDVKLLQGVPREQFEAALDWATARIAAAKKTPGAQAVLYVYTSSHGDGGKGLELGAQTYAWADFKAALAATKADVRVAIVDACHSSGLLEAGGKSARGFDIRAEDRLTVAGEAFITSSAADEPSLEAGAYQGSVFTHHLLAALRGAADRSGDGKVSLEELYQYAYARAVEGDSGQHPGYGFKLAGHGELFVSGLQGAATVTLPRAPEALAVQDADTGQLFLEIRKPDARTFALPPGRWALKLWRGGKARVGRVTLAAGQRLSIDEASFTEAPAETAQLVRLSAGAARYCLTPITAPPPLLALAQRLTRHLQAQEGHACLAGALPAALTLSTEPTQRLRVKGLVGTRPVDVLADEASIAADLARAIAAAL